jgi:hypothetical protein
MTFFGAGMVFGIAVAFPDLLRRTALRFFLESFGLLAFALAHDKPPLGK